MKTIVAYVVLLTLVMGSHPTRLAADDAIHVRSALLTVVERIDVPAAEEGLLTSLTVREGDLVEPGQVLGATDTRSATLQLDQVMQDLQLAREFAKNDTRVRLARKEHELSQVELERAHKVNEGFANSVSAKEIDRLKLSVERTRLEIEFAQFEQSQNAQKMKRIEADLRLAQHQLELRRILAPHRRHDCARGQTERRMGQSGRSRGAYRARESAAQRRASSTPNMRSWDWSGGRRESK